jgi:hypothetical protein
MVRPVFIACAPDKCRWVKSASEDGAGAGGGLSLHSLLQFRARGIHLSFAKTVGGI